MANRKYCKMKEIDDVMGGAAAWENVDSTEIQCDECGHKRAYFFQVCIIYKNLIVLKFE